MMKPATIALAILLSSCASAPPPATATPPAHQGAVEDPAVDEDPWVLNPREEPVLLRGELGKRITLVGVKSRAVPGGAFLLLREGAGLEDDGLVLVVKREGYALDGQGRGLSFELTLRGEPRILLNQESRSGWHEWHPRGRKPLAVDEEAVVDAAEILALYEEQRASGKLEELAPQDREGRIRWQQLQFEEDSAPMAKSCGLSPSIDWATVEDEWFDQFSISRTCLKQVRQVADFCRIYPHKIEEVQELRRLQCKFEGHPDSTEGSIRKDKDALTMVPGTRAGKRLNIGGVLALELRRLFDVVDLLFRSGKRFIVLREDSKVMKIYAGTAAKLYPQHIAGASRAVNYDEWQLWAGGTSASIKAEAGKWTLKCGDETTTLELVLGEEKAKLLKNMRFETEYFWKRTPYYLGRDSRGIYYYVDALLDSQGGSHHRVFIGRRGQVKLTKLIGLVEDSKGMLFSTNKGDLRLIVEQSRKGSEATWIRSKKVTALTSVPLRRNHELIYQSLGAYFGESFGDACGQ